MLFIQPLKDAILQQMEKAEQRASPRLGILCGHLMYTNQIEAAMLRVHSTNEKAGYNLL